MADDDDDGAAYARSLWADCLRTLARISHQSPDPDTREYASTTLQRGLVMLRAVLEDPEREPDVRQDAIEALRGFLDS